MRGKIIKGIAGFYYVHDGISQVYECKAKGVFRSRKIKPLVGDDVEFTVLDEKEQTGNITDILERKNELIRPAVANIGHDRFCGDGSGAKFKSPGPVPGDHGNAGSACGHLL